MRDDLIREVQDIWGREALSRGMTPEELMNCAGHFLANILLSISKDEAAAHELMNGVTAANHLYINASWPSAKEKRDIFEEGIARAARRGDL